MVEVVHPFHKFVPLGIAALQVSQMTLFPHEVIENPTGILETSIAEELLEFLDPAGILPFERLAVLLEYFFHLFNRDRFWPGRRFLWAPEVLQAQEKQKKGHGILLNSSSREPISMERLA
ncbi:MAG: hypothetical protein QF645_03695, partial [Planctomycetota bacterium]|nr:hypothetical protein [Planctomycetota bacterium]